MSETNQLDPVKVCRLLVGLLQGSVDETLIREVLGTSVVRSAPQVAQAFGVSDATVRNTWRRDGMPGKAKRGTNKANEYNLAEILLWWLNRERDAAKGRGRDEYTDRMHAARAEREEVELQMARRKLERETGSTVELAVVRSEVADYITNVRDNLLEIPRHVKPMLPSKVAEEATAEIDRLIRLELTKLSEMEPGDFTKGVNGHGQDEE